MVSSIGMFCSTYEVPKKVRVQTPFAFIPDLVKFIVFFGALGWAVWDRDYQKYGPVESALVTRIKGVTYLQQLEHAGASIDDNVQHQLDGYKKIWDIPDIIIPPSENNAFFITTNVVFKANQTRSTCDEDPDERVGAICDPLDNKCIKGVPLLTGNGIMTGNCIPSTRRNTSVHVCEIHGWCPVLARQDNP